MSAQIKVAIGSDFLKAFSAIPRAQQNKVMNFVTDFRENPTKASINYETIRDFRDPNLRSVRIDQTYRGIVLKPERGNVYMLLWVDHHDKAYRWARHKRFEIHPDTGGLQIIDVSQAEAAAAPEPTESTPGLFDGFRDRQLRRLGVPEALLSLVRGIKGEADLERAQGPLPTEAYEALFYLAAGDAYEDVVRELEADQEVDTEDFQAALAHPDTQRRFSVVADDEELERMLLAPLAQWRVFLHPAQRKLVENRWRGPTRVLGGAGTGKTVVAMHRARFLAERVFTGEHDRVLFTTFSRNLAEDIRANLRTLCKEAAFRRIEVINLDRWVYLFLKQSGYERAIAYGDMAVEHWRAAMAEAPAELNLPDSFYREEWEQVVQAREIAGLPDYLRASRTGRGVRLSRGARKQVWRVFETYRALLGERGLREPEDAMLDARHLLEHQGDVLPYRAVVVDEAQDMSPQAFRLIRQMVPKTSEHDGEIFIAGDAHQRIYRHHVVLSRCGVNIRGRSRKLKVNYRTTEENRRFAVSLLHGAAFDDLDGGDDPIGAQISLVSGQKPEIRHVATQQEETEAIVGFLRHLLANGGCELSDVCLVARVASQLDDYERAIAAAGWPCYRIRRREPEDRRQPGLRLATMHRVKGLEFDHLIMAGVNEGVLPLRQAVDNTCDETVRRERERQELALLYVAATRARRSLLVSSYGRPSRFLHCGEAYQA